MTTPQSSSERWMFMIPAGLALVLCLLSAGFAFGARYEARKSAAVRAWPSTTATVTHSGLVPYQYLNRNDGTTHQAQRVMLSFQYVVQGRPYEVTTLEFAGDGTSGHEDKVRYTERQSVQAFYNPQHPAEAVLTRERTTPVGLLVIIAVACGLLSVPFGYGAARWFAKSRAA